MNRFANGASRTDEYCARVEYNVGYRDGYNAARERAAAETAVLRAQLESVMELLAALTPPTPMLVSAAEAERLVKLGVRMVVSE